jgi:hypothetical protein
MDFFFPLVLINTVIVFLYCYVIYVFCDVLKCIFYVLGLGTGDREVPEPCSVYSRRKTSHKQKGKEKAIAVPLSCPPAVKTRNIRYIAYSFSFMRF